MTPSLTLTALPLRGCDAVLMPDRGLLLVDDSLDVIETRWVRSVSARLVQYPKPAGRELVDEATVAASRHTIPAPDLAAALRATQCGYTAAAILRVPWEAVRCRLLHQTPLDAADLAGVPMPAQWPNDYKRFTILVKPEAARQWSVPRSRLGAVRP